MVLRESVGFGSVRSMAGLNDPKGLLQPKQCYESFYEG